MILGSLAKIYSGAANLKNLFYEQGLLHSEHMDFPVVSIGNLSMGGTGKTPVCLHLARVLPPFLGARRAVVVTRSYRTSRTEPAEVQLGLAHGAEIFGDEALELAEKGPLPVVTGPDKTQSAIFAAENLHPDLLLLDDGFQHRKLARDFDLVLLDPTDSKVFPLPAGRLRESFENLKRAHAVVLTKVNWAGSEQVARLRARIPAGVPVFEAEFRWQSEDLFREQSFGRPVALLSALARNELFREQVELSLGRPVDQMWSFRDHHAFSLSDFARCEDWLRQNPQGLIVTTGKDEVKLRSFRQVADPRWWTLQLKIQIRNENELLQLILQKLRERPS